MTRPTTHERKVPPLTPYPAAVGVSLPTVTRSEWIKFRGLASNLVLAGLTFVLLVANSLLMAWAYVLRDRSSPKADYDVYPELMLDKTPYLAILLAILAALVVTNEYRSGQVTWTFLAAPRRVPVLAAKALLVALVSLVVGTVSAAIGLLAAPPILATGGYGYDLPPSEALRLVLGSGLYLAGISVVGIAVGVFVRSMVASVLTVLVVLVLAPVVPQLVSPEGARLSALFPVQAGSRLVAAPDPAALGPWTGFLVLLAWVAVLLGAAAIVLTRRDT